MNRALRRHIMYQSPHLDATDKFAFFANAKVAQKSISWGVIAPRCIMKTHGTRNYKRYLKTRNFDKMFKFTIVRNPWDRAVSAFHYLRNTGAECVGSDENFSEFVKTRFRKDSIKIDRHFHHQYPNAEFNGKVFVDFIGRFERINEDWSIIAKKIDASPDLPHENKSVHKPYQHYYDDKEVFEIVSEVYRRDIELFEYSYE